MKWLWLIPIVALIALLLPSPITAVERRIGQSIPLTGVLAPNDALRQVELIGEGRIFNPEDVAFDAMGRMYVGSRDVANGDVVGKDDINARIERVTFLPDGTHRIEEWVKLPGGGPLDVRFDKQQNLIVSSWGQGIIQIAPDKTITTLVADGTMIDGTPFGYADGQAIHSDGRIFFTQGTSGEYSSSRVVQDVLSGKGYGRLLEYTPQTKTVRVLIPDLSFGNGVVLAPDESYILVADQLRYTIKRYWLTGAKAGMEDVFADDVPGFVHNLFLDQRNVLWAAITQPRNPLVDSLSGLPWVREQIAKLPSTLFNAPVSRDESKRSRGFVVTMNLQGQYLASYGNPPAKLNSISSAVVHDGYLYVGSITGGPVIRHRLKP
jgi:sugar lactone lactonase YvrE